MDFERAFTVWLVAFVAGSTTAFVLLTAVVTLTEEPTPVWIGLVAASGLGAAVLVGRALSRNATDEQLTGP